MLSAVTQNQPDELLAALTDGADPNFQRTKNTPLILAMANGNRECAQILLDHGADLNMPNGFGWLPIHEACQQGWEDWVEMTLSNAMNLSDRRDRQETSPLLIAVQHGHEAIASRLVAAESDVNAQNEQGVSPLMLAIERQSATLVGQMMENKGDPSLKDGTGRSGFDRAENWPQGQGLLGSGPATVAASAPAVSDADAAQAQEAGVSGIQKRRRPA